MSAQSIANDLQKMFDSIFYDKNITHERLSICAEDHEIRMINNNPGDIYHDSIDAIHAARLNLDSFRNKKFLDKGTRKGGTSAKDDCRALIEVYVANNIGYCRSKFGGKDNYRYIATFPQGMKAFYNVSDKNFETSVENLISNAHTYVGVLGNTFESELNALYHNYTVADATHGTQMVAYSNDIVTEQMAADVLADQMMDDALLIARNNRRSTTAAQVYFNTALLFPKKGTEIYEGNVPAQSRQEVCDIVYSAGKHTHIHINGAVALTFGMELNGMRVGKLFTGEPDDRLDIAFSDYFTNGTKIYVLNESDMEGMFRMEIVS